MRQAVTSSLRPRIAELILRESIVELSKVIRERAAGSDELRGMGATVDLIWVPTSNAQAHLAHIGDSRIYRFRNGALEQLTEDHTLLALLIKHGEVRPEDAGRHPARSQISRYVGMDGEAKPDVATIALEAGDRLLLCTDGLTNMVTAERIAGVLEEWSEPEEACRSLVAAANEAGGRDNISVIVTDIAFR
jgi:serine/threonine protein phosphatase PrpC